MQTNAGNEQALSNSQLCHIANAVDPRELFRIHAIAATDPIEIFA
jgi:hypothetical protein